MGSNSTIVDTQTLLKKFGFDPGTIDGIWGNRSEKAYQDLVAGNINYPEVVSIPWGAKLSLEELTKLRQVIASLGLPPHNIQDFMACMAWETGETFSPSIKNPRSTATGLIQFMKATAIGLGTTVEALAKMTVVEQLDYVQKHFVPYRKRIKNLGDVYMAILLPKGIGQPDSYVMWRKGDDAFIPNKGIDLNEDGVITRLECLHKVRNKLVRGFLPQFVRNVA